MNLLPIRADDRERDDEQERKHRRHGEGNWTDEDFRDAGGPVRAFPTTRAAMPEHDPRAEVARWLDLYRPDRGGFVERVLELREVTRALRASVDVRRDDVAVGLAEGAESVGGEIFGRVALGAHRSSSRRSRSVLIAKRTR